MHLNLNEIKHFLTSKYKTENLKKSRKVSICKRILITFHFSAEKQLYSLKNALKIINFKIAKRRMLKAKYENFMNDALFFF